MKQRILITGSCGLVGRGLAPVLQNIGADLRFLDLVGIDDACGDVRNIDRVRTAIDGCHGVIHLAAVSRVIWGEQQPELCWATNVGGLRNVLESSATSQLNPWVISASSREVYGQPDSLPADEDCPVRPVNIYGRSKVEGELLVKAAQRDGVRACTIRLSNVFGSTSDHADRVVPAFARAAALGAPLRVDGADHTFDFTHIDDVAQGIAALAVLLSEGGLAPPPIHFVSGVPTTLQQLAEMAIRLASSTSSIRYAPPRNFDVAQFVGCNERAKQVLDWTPRVSLEVGLLQLIKDFQLDTNLLQEVAT